MNKRDIIHTSAKPSFYKNKTKKEIQLTRNQYVNSIFERIEKDYSYEFIMNNTKNNHFLCSPFDLGFDVNINVTNGEIKSNKVKVYDKKRLDFRIDSSGNKRYMLNIRELFENKNTALYVNYDDVDISKVPLKTLRKQVTVIP